MRQGQRWRLWASGHGAHGQQPPEATTETRSDSPSEPSGELPLPDPQRLWFRLLAANIVREHISVVLGQQVCGIFLGSIALSP